MVLFLQKKVIENPKLTDEGLAVYIALRRIMNDEEKNYYVSINMLIYLLCGNIDYTTRFYESIKDGLKNLIDIKIIKVDKAINQRENIVNLSDLYFSTDKVKETKDYFTRIYLNEINTIMNCEKDKFKILKYFVFLMGTLSNITFTYTDGSGLDNVKSFIGGLTIDYLSELSDIHKTSIIKYNKLLEEKQLIYVYRHDDFILENGEIKSLHNGYGRYADKEYIIKYSHEYADSKKSYNCNKSANKRKGNEKKSMLMKYNAIANGNGDKYELKEIKKIYEFIVNYNKEIDTNISKVLHSKGNSEEYINMQVENLSGKKKKISVFKGKGYDFVKDVPENNETVSVVTHINKFDTERTVTYAKPPITPYNPFNNMDDEASEHFLKRDIAEALELKIEDININDIVDYDEAI